MSEVKGTLLTIILALTVFGVVFGLVTVAINKKADEVATKIDEAGNVEKGDSDKDQETETGNETLGIRYSY